MNRDTQRAKAEAFRAMHDRSRILVLPNAWDAMSARVIEEAGARAIATTSAGVAFSVGYPDGEAIPRDEMIAAIARIARVVTVPVSADIESGFANDTRELAETIRRVIEAGAVGINLEDQVHDGTRRLYDLDIAVERVRAARVAAEATGVPLVIKYVTSCELIHRDISEHADRDILEENYFRLNVPQGMSTISLAECDKLGDMIALINRYMYHGNMKKKKQKIAELLPDPQLASRFS